MRALVCPLYYLVSSAILSLMSMFDHLLKFSYSYPEYYILGCPKMESFVINDNISIHYSLLPECFFRLHLTIFILLKSQVPQKVTLPIVDLPFIFCTIYILHFICMFVI